MYEGTCLGPDGWAEEGGEVGERGKEEGAGSMQRGGPVGRGEDGGGGRRRVNEGAYLGACGFSAGRKLPPPTHPHAGQVLEMEPGLAWAKTRAWVPGASEPDGKTPPSQTPSYVEQVLEMEPGLAWAKEVDLRLLTAEAAELEKVCMRMGALVWG